MLPNWWESVQPKKTTSLNQGEDNVHDLLCALNTSSEAGLQWSMNKFSSVCNAFGLTISTERMQVMCQPAPHTMEPNPRISVKGNALEVVGKFTYLRSVLSKNVTIDDEVNNRLAKASAIFSRLSKNLWDHEGLSAHTKLKVYKAVVLSTILYACETWTLYSRHVKNHLNCLCRFLYIQCWYRIPDTEVLNHAMLSNIHTYLCKAQLHWAGHVLRMDEESPKVSTVWWNLLRERDPLEARRSILRTLWRPLLKTSPLILTCGRTWLRTEPPGKCNASWSGILWEPMNKPCINEESCMQGQGSVLSAQTVLSMSVHTVADSSMYVLA